MARSANTPHTGKTNAPAKAPFAHVPNKHVSKAMRRADAKLKARQAAQPKDANGYHFITPGSRNPRSR